MRPATRPAWSQSPTASRVTCGEIVPSRYIGAKNSTAAQVTIRATMARSFRCPPVDDPGPTGRIVPRPGQQDDEDDQQREQAGEEQAVAERLELGRLVGDPAADVVAEHDAGQHDADDAGPTSRATRRCSGPGTGWRRSPGPSSRSWRRRRSRRRRARDRAGAVGEPRLGAPRLAFLPRRSARRLPAPPSDRPRTSQPQRREQRRDAEHDRRRRQVAPAARSRSGSCRPGCRACRGRTPGRRRGRCGGTSGSMQLDRHRRDQAQHQAGRQAGGQRQQRDAQVRAASAAGPRRRRGARRCRASAASSPAPASRSRRSVRSLAARSASRPPSQLPRLMPARKTPMTAVQVSSDTPTNGASSRPATSCRTSSAALATKDDDGGPTRDDGGGGGGGNGRTP